MNRIATLANGSQTFLKLWRKLNERDGYTLNRHTGRGLNAVNKMTEFDK